MNRRDFLKSLAGAFAASLAQPFVHPAMAQLMPGRETARAAGRSRPNIICILSDDVGLGNIGCYGGKFRTPNIDALAQDGIRFERCCSTPLCGPSRCQLLTGQYPFRTGLINNQSAQAISPVRQIMIPTIMKAAGYATASVGKWGQMSLGPREWGFDEHLVFRGSGKYWASQGNYLVNGQRKALGEQYLPDMMHRFLVDFARRHSERPFFVYYPMSHIHGPILKTPDTRRGSDLYADNVEYMDKLVGRLVAELDRLKLRENTLVLFTGDNGTAGGPNRAPVNGRPLSGSKGTMREGGSRVPLIASWPGTVAAGKVLPDLIDFSDFLPTFAALGGAALPKDRTLDGRSFAPRLFGQDGNPRQCVYVELAGRRYVRDDRWKLTGAGELFDLKNAPFEETPVPRDTRDPQAVMARKQLHAALVALVGEQRLGGPGGMDRPARNPARRAPRRNRDRNQP